MHIHVVKAEHEAKFWLEPEIEMAENHGFVISNFAPPSFRKVEQPLIRKVEQPE
jgi:predicted deacetylase